MTNNTALTVVHKHLAKGGALCKEFNRVRVSDNQNWRIEQAYAMEMIRDSKSLQACTPESIGRSLVDLGSMGLSLSPAKKEAYLIPYKGNCTASVSYMGMEQIAYRTGMVEGIQTGVVREHDEFREWADDQGKHIEHTVSSRRGEITHSYCIAWLTSGRTLIEVMDQEALRACRDAAAFKNDGNIPFTWKGKFREEMYKKCALRRGWKHWPKVTNPQLVQMLEAVERTDPMDFREDKAKVVNESGAKIDVQGQTSTLIDMALDAGYPESGIDRQLQGLAAGMGYDNIRAIPANEFERAVSLMEKGLRRWKDQKSPTSAPSGSEQVVTTAQTEGI
jgi:phage RecT family recombinase